jgi:hypothetical protein
VNEVGERDTQINLEMRGCEAISGAINARAEL